VSLPRRRVTAPTKDLHTAPERAALREIGGLSDQVRSLRRTDAVGNKTHIQAVERQLRVKWDELRTLRAGSVKRTDVQREGSHAFHRIHESSGR
jgi:hypothetical protein